jgi:peptide/nickel transport system substrate-binding protein
MADRTGQQFGNYRLVAQLGTGGYAEVYLGQHVRFNQQAAIKVLHTHLSGQEAEHFQQEAETIATLAHPSIVRVFDFDVQDGVPFLVMDCAPNGSLRQRYPKGSLVPLPQIISSVKQVAAALQYAHEQKFVHRDVKPENMLLGRREEVLLSDFGIATVAHSTASLSAQPTVGTLAYMAPEQIEGHPRPASDQYALGVVVYEWLCGERPFEGSVTEIMVKHLSMPPPPLRERVPTIPPEIEQVVLRALAKDPKERFASVRDFATALEQASQHTLSPTAQLSSEQPAPAAAPATFVTVAAPTSQPILPNETPSELAESPQTPPDMARKKAPALTPPAAPLAAATLLPTVLPPPLEPTMPVQQKVRRLPRTTAALLIGLVVVIIAAGVLGSLSLLAHFGVLGAHSGSLAIQVARGGTWTYSVLDPGSLIPNGVACCDFSEDMDQALYLPLFYGDAQGVIRAGAVTEVPTIQNSGVNVDATIWTFHLRPHLLWSDGQPYDARDVDFTWRLWSNPKFSVGNTFGLNLISSAKVSADHLSITFHLKRPFAPFLAELWVDGVFAPLPAHHFSTMDPGAILKSPENLNPKVVSGPFMMRESLPGDHYTLVRNPRYYRTREGLPYLDKMVFPVVPGGDAVLKDLQAGSLDASSVILDPDNFQKYQRLKNYTIIYPPAPAFEALYFNFHNTVLASHLEVRLAMAMAVDQRAMIDGPLHGLGSQLCTDHPAAFHPGYEPFPNCPAFDLAAANKLLDDNGWVKGPDGVRARGGQRLEFEYSTAAQLFPYRLDIEIIIRRDFQQIGIKLDIQNYPSNMFFGSILPQGKASPPTGAVAGRYDIAEYANNLYYDPDDSIFFACNQVPPTGINFGFYCNPALDALYAQEQATADPGVRQQIFMQIHQIYLTQFPFIGLYNPTFFALVHKGTHNYLPGPYTDTYNIAEWWCDNGKC